MSIRIRCKVCRRLKLTDPTVSQDNCQSHKERKYEAVIWDGRKQVTKTFPMADLAKRWERDELNRIKLGTFKRIQPVTFNEFADAHLDSKSGLRPAVVSNYRYIFDDYLKPILGKYKMASIDSDLIDKVVRNVETRSFSLRQKVNTQLKTIFSKALAKDVVARNPTGHLEMLKRTERVVYNTLDNKQINSLLTLPPGILPSHIKLYYKMSIYLGLRPEELIGLPVWNINMDKGEVKIDQVVYWLKNPSERAMYPGKKFLILSPKTFTSNRVIPIGKELLKDIQIHLIEGYRENKHNLLFTSDQRTPMNYDNLRKRHWYRHRKAAGLPEMDLYDLRHTFASILAAEGTDMVKIKELMGHSDISTTANIYTHVMKRDNSAIAEKFEKYVNSPAS